jgi:hypothetical protein
VLIIIFFILHTLIQDPGYWVVAKWADEEETELHVTAFIVSRDLDPDL